MMKTNTTNTYRIKREKNILLPSKIAATNRETIHCQHPGPVQDPFSILHDPSIYLNLYKTTILQANNNNASEESRKHTTTTSMPMYWTIKRNKLTPNTYK